MHPSSFGHIIVNTNFDPVYKGDSDGYFSKSRKTGAPVVASDLSYEFSMAVVNALKKTELSK
ncbi:MAG: hypothetical protein GX202_04280 [Firmicutes bacterium]|nr:hypothetical protein [Bacillota bacterium]